MLIMAASAVMQRIGGPASAAPGDEFSIRCQAQNTGDVACFLRIVLYDADTGEVLYDYGKHGLISPGSTLNPFPGTYPDVKLVIMPDHDWNLVAKVWVDDRVSPDDSLTKTIFLPKLTLSGIEIISRYGSKFYLKGEIQNIVAADELCLMYSRPGSADLLNLPSLIIPYTYMHGTAGTYGLQVGGKYLEFSASGYYIFELWRVSGTCETRTEKVAEYILKLEAPKYQYQLYFDLDAPEIASNRHLLQGEYDKYNAAKPWTVVPEGEDCFSRIEPSASYPGGSLETGWLCQAGEFLSSGCSPLPWWMCPSWTDWDIYMRGECSCSDFKDILQPLGIPCMHLIAAKEYYGDNPPYCPYKVCG